MKPVLIVTSNVYHGYSAYESYTLFLAQLAGLGIPIEIRQAGNVTHDEYSCAIVAYAESAPDPVDCRPWAQGTKPYPVLVLHDNHTTSANWPNRASTASTWNDATTKVTTSTGHYIYTYSYVYAGLADDAGGVTTTPLLWVDGYAARTRCVAWRVDGQGAGNSWQVFHSGKNALPILCYFLKQAGVVPSRPIVYYICLDDITGNIAENSYVTGYVENLRSMLEWCKAHNAMVAGGVIPADITAGLAAGLPALLKQYQQDGCLRMLLHDHTNKMIGDDTAPWDTVAGKVTAWRAACDGVIAAGYDISDDGAYGVGYFPTNSITTLGFKALGRLGIRAIRAYSATGVVGSTIAGPIRDTLRCRIHDSEEDAVYPLTMVGDYNPMNYNVTAWTSWLAGGVEGVFYNYSLYTLGPQLMSHKTMTSFHPLNLTGGQANPEDDAPMLKYYQRIIEPLIDWGGPEIIRCASRADWQLLGSGYRHWRSARKGQTTGIGEIDVRKLGN